MSSIATNNERSDSGASLRRAAGRPLHYRPFLFTKPAERKALMNLDAQTAAAITPVYVVTPRDWDYENDRHRLTFDEHIAKVAAGMSEILTVGRAYLEVSLVEDEGAMSTGMSPMAHLIDAAPGYLTVVPMVSPNSSMRTIRVAQAAASSDGAAVRLAVPEWPSSAPSVIASLQQQLGLQRSAIDLFLDVGDDLGPLAVRAVVDEMHHLGSSDPFRTVTFVGAAWPKTLPAGVANHEIPRRDFTSFADVVAECARRGLPTPDYADWTVVHPDPTLNVDPKILNIAAALRYAVTDKWILGKGQLYKGNGGKSLGGSAVRPMLTALIAHPDYACLISGDTETWIDDVISGRTSSGNPTTWRQWAVLRHLALTAHQLST
jgi:hypothetical protein